MKTMMEFLGIGCISSAGLVVFVINLYTCQFSEVVVPLLWAGSASYAPGASSLDMCFTSYTIFELGDPEASLSSVEVRVVMDVMLAPGTSREGSIAADDDDGSWRRRSKPGPLTGGIMGDWK